LRILEHLGKGGKRIIYTFLFSKNQPKALSLKFRRGIKWLFKNDPSERMKGWECFAFLFYGESFEEIIG